MLSMKKRKAVKFKNKPELILELGKNQDLSLKEATLCVDQIQKEMIQALLKGKRIEIRGFGSFCIRHYKGYKGRNPQNQKKITVRPKKRPYFKSGIFKEELNP